MQGHRQTFAYGCKSPLKHSRGRISIYFSAIKGPSILYFISDLFQENDLSWWVPGNHFYFFQSTQILIIHEHNYQSNSSDQRDKPLLSLSKIKVSEKAALLQFVQSESGMLGSRGGSHLSGWACVVSGSGCGWSAPRTWDTGRVCRGRWGWASLCCWWKEQCRVGRDTEHSPDYKEKKKKKKRHWFTNKPEKWSKKPHVWKYEAFVWHVTFLLKSFFILEISGSDLHLKSHSHWLCTSEHTQGISSQFCFFGQQAWAQTANWMLFSRHGHFLQHINDLQSLNGPWGRVYRAEQMKSKGVFCSFSDYLQMKLKPINFSSQSKFH